MRKKRSASGCSAFMRWYCCMAGVWGTVMEDIGGRSLTEEDFSVCEQLEVHRLGLRGGLGQRHGADVRAVQRDHDAEPALQDAVDRLDPEAAGQHAVEGGGGAAA